MMKYIQLCKPIGTNLSNLAHSNYFFPELKKLKWYNLLAAGFVVFALVYPEAVRQFLNGNNSSEIMLGQLFFLGHIPIGKILSRFAKTLSVKPINSDHLSLSDISIEDFIDDEIRFTKAEEMRLKKKYGSKENLDSDLLENQPFDDLWDEEPDRVQYTFELKEVSSKRNSLKQDIIKYFQTVGFHLFLFACFYSFFVVLL